MRPTVKHKQFSAFKVLYPAVAGLARKDEPVLYKLQSCFDLICFKHLKAYVSKEGDDSYILRVCQIHIFRKGSFSKSTECTLIIHTNKHVYYLTKWRRVLFFQEFTKFQAFMEHEISLSLSQESALPRNWSFLKNLYLYFHLFYSFFELQQFVCSPFTRN